jgi:hypothetical protein
MSVADALRAIDSRTIIVEDNFDSSSNTQEENDIKLKVEK